MLIGYNFIEIELIGGFMYRVLVELLVITMTAAVLTPVLGKILGVL